MNGVGLVFQCSAQVVTAAVVGQPFRDFRGGARRQVVQDDVHAQPARDGRVDLFEEPQYVGAAVALAQMSISPVATFIAANRSMVPCRL